MSPGTPANADARRAAILVATQDGVVSVSELSRRLAVTESTIRRDLQRLERDQKLVRTYGGTMSLHSTEATSSEKAGRHQPEKAAIARWALERIVEDQTLLLDAGTTVGALAERLRHRRRLTAIAVGMDSVVALRDADEIELILLGGRLRHVNQGVVGPFAELVLSMVSADHAFLGAEGVDPGRGISCPTAEQASLKWRMMRSAGQSFVLADHSKLGRSAFAYWCPWPESFTLVTDSGASAECLADLHRVPGCTVATVDVALAA